jgi:sarcosine oxidase
MGEGLWIATERREETMSTDSPGRTKDDAAEIHAGLFADTIPGVSARCLRSETCLYTVTPDAGFVIDRHPDMDNVIFVSACSGHGFKHSAAIGEALAQGLVEGESVLDLGPFSLSRFRP